VDISAYRSPLEVPPERTYIDAIRTVNEMTGDRAASLPHKAVWRRGYAIDGQRWLSRSD
jgi:hypothetical protein